MVLFYTYFLDFWYFFWMSINAHKIKAFWTFIISRHRPVFLLTQEWQFRLLFPQINLNWFPLHLILMITISLYALIIKVLFMVILILQILFKEGYRLISFCWLHWLNLVIILIVFTQIVTIRTRLFLFFYHFFIINIPIKFFKSISRGYIHSVIWWVFNIVAINYNVAIFINIETFLFCSSFCFVSIIHRFLFD